jgi:hypothetical protein
MQGGILLRLKPNGNTGWPGKRSPPHSGAFATFGPMPVFRSRTRISRPNGTQLQPTIRTQRARHFPPNVVSESSTSVCHRSRTLPITDNLRECPSDSTSRWTPCPPEYRKLVPSGPPWLASGFRLRARLVQASPCLLPPLSGHALRRRPCASPRSGSEKDLHLQAATIHGT